MNMLDYSAFLLRLDGISKSYPGVVANKSIDLDVVTGEIHGLLGENGAGKTTLMRILYGLVSPDSGTIEFKGSRIQISSPKDALRAGIGMVHQHFMLVPDMTVTENVALGMKSERRPFSDLRGTAKAVEDLSDRHGLGVDPWAKIEDLTVGTRQKVEILKLLYRGADVLILDEPTSVLRPQEWKELAAILRSLVNDGRAAIFITHKLDELFDVADRCTVLRSGEVVGTVVIKDTDKVSLSRMMVGREVVLRVPRIETKLTSPKLSVSNLTLNTPDGRQALNDLTFEIQGGEILGIAGVDGNGQQELVDVLVGVTQRSEGTISIMGQSVPHLTPDLFKNLGGAVITDDRHKTGLALSLSLQDNLIMRDFRDQPFSKNGVLDFTEIRNHSANLTKEYDIRTTSLNLRAAQLSGGNQQKVVLARELHRQPDLLVAMQPTRGLDVGAMEFVYTQLIEHKKRGGAVLLISYELEEILSLSDRIAVISSGEFMEILDWEDATTERLGLLMAGERTS